MFKGHIFIHLKLSGLEIRLWNTDFISTCETRVFGHRTAIDKAPMVLHPYFYFQKTLGNQTLKKLSK